MELPASAPALGKMESQQLILCSRFPSQRGWKSGWEMGRLGLVIDIRGTEALNLSWR